MEGVEWHLCDLTDAESTKIILRLVKPHVIIHCAAMVDVDGCESDPEGAHALHVGATKTLVSESKTRGIHLIYISTDSVFDGKKRGAYTEKDLPNPMNIYARTKLEGEEVVLAIEEGLVLRTNIFGWTRQGKSFGEWIINGLRKQEPLTMFTDVFFSPISTYGFAKVIKECIKKGTTGLFHAAGKAVLSKCDFAFEVASAFGLPATCINPVQLNDVKLGAPRPQNMALDSSKIANALGIFLPDVRTSVGVWRTMEPRCIREYGRN